MLVGTAQELVDKAASAPPGDMDDAHPGAHGLRRIYKNLNHMSYGGHKGMYARQKDMRGATASSRSQNAAAGRTRASATTSCDHRMETSPPGRSDQSASAHTCTER
jgi:hypothetical protein